MARTRYVLIVEPIAADEGLHLLRRLLKRLLREFGLKCIAIERTSPPRSLVTVTSEAGQPSTKSKKVEPTAASTTVDTLGAVRPIGLDASGGALAEPPDDLTLAPIHLRLLAALKATGGELEARGLPAAGVHVTSMLCAAAALDLQRAGLIERTKRGWRLTEGEGR